MKKNLLQVLLAASAIAVATGCSQQSQESASAQEAAPKAATSALDTIKARGHVQCGINTGLPGFATANSDGSWSGIDVDYCKAIAAAVFGDASKVRYTQLTAKERFTALSSGEIDVLNRNTTWTMLRDTQLGITFPGGVNYYDGQGFLVKSSLGVTSVSQLNGATFCIQAGTTTELNLADYFRAKGMRFTAITYDTSQQTKDGFDQGRCNALTSDQSQLAALRTQLNNPNSAVVLPEVISKEPLGPVVRQGDEQWLKIVRWVHYALLNAEELGVTQANVQQMKSSENPSIRRLLGVEGDFGPKLGLSADWAASVVSSVGNYGEVFDRNVGSGSTLQLPRGINKLWTEGGVQYAPPIR